MLSWFRRRGEALNEVEGEAAALIVAYCGSLGPAWPE